MRIYKCDDNEFTSLDEVKEYWLENYCFDDYDFEVWLNSNYNAAELWELDIYKKEDILEEYEDSAFEDWCSWAIEEEKEIEEE